MYYDKRVFSEDDVKSLDTMLEKGKVSFPFDNGWYLASFYAANGCTIFGDGTDESKGYDFGGDNAVAVTKYIVDLFNNKNFVMDDHDGSGSFFHRKKQRREADPFPCRCIRCVCPRTSEIAGFARQQTAPLFPGGGRIVERSVAATVSRGAGSPAG